MIEVLSGSELVFSPISNTDQRLQAILRLRNPNRDRQMAIKVKSSDINAFEADPSKSIIQPQEEITIPISTVHAVDSNYARDLSTRNKFLIEYVLLSKKYSSIDEAVNELKGPTTQNVKIYINMNSVRMGSELRSSKQPSVSARYSFHSMGLQQQGQGQSTQDRMIEEYDRDELTKLKDNIDILEKKRMRLAKEVEVKAKHKSGGMLKYVIVLAIGLVAGNIGGHYIGLNDYLGNKIEGLKKKPKQEEEGFFSIFNFGDSEETEKPWWDIL